MRDMIDLTLEINGINGIVKPLSHYCVSTHVGLSMAYQDTKGTLRVRTSYIREHT